MKTILILGTVMLAIFLARQNPLAMMVAVLEALLSLRIRIMHASRMAVVDGDTIRFRHRRLLGLLGYEFRKGRLRGIDAPESGQMQGPQATDGLRRILLSGGWHLVVICKKDVYDRELMWLISLRGPVGLRMLWRGHAFATTIVGMPIALVARLFRRGMWSGGRVTDPATWRQRNNHRLIR